MNPQVLTSQHIAEGLAKAFGWPLQEAMQEVDRFSQHEQAKALLDLADELDFRTVDKQGKRRWWLPRSQTGQVVVSATGLRRRAEATWTE